MLFRRQSFVRALLMGALLWTPLTQATAQTPVDLELALLADVSGSVSTAEFQLQRDGYVNFFANTSASFWTNRTIAVSYSYWSGLSQQAMMPGGVGGWWLINSQASSLLFSNAILAFDRPYSGLTAPGSAINWITPQFATNTFDGARQVIDVSGDGCQNNGATTSTARTATQNLGIVINGITIGGGSDCPQSGQAAFEAWYGANVVTDDGFLLTAADFDTFGGAVATKIGREITGDVVPEPASMTLLATGLAGLAAARRRRHAKS